MDLQNLEIDEYTSVNPTTTSQDTSVLEMMHLMDVKGIRHIPVVDNNEKLVGIVSERDLKMVINKGWEEKLSAQDVMTDNPYTVNSGRLLKEVVFEMSEKKIGSALVMDKDGKLMGIFTSVDALNVLIEIL